MILCITPNAAVDRTLTIPGFRKGRVCRATDTFIAAGGKGLNVARAIRTLGGRPLCAGFVGGYSGQLLQQLAREEGLEGIWTSVEQETRACTIIIDPEEKAEEPATVLNEPGAAVTAADWNRLQADVLRASTRARSICLCGSLPVGSPPESLAALIQALRAANRPIWIDTSGPALQAALSAGPSGIKVNGAEAGAILGHTVTGAADALQAAAEIRRLGVGMVVLTLGSAGAVLVNETGSWQARPSAIQAVSAVGSGDAFLAGLLTGLVAAAPPAEALRRAVAAGAANALTPGGGRFELSHFQAHLAGCTVEMIPGQPR